MRQLAAVFQIALLVFLSRTSVTSQDQTTARGLLDQPAAPATPKAVEPRHELTAVDVESFLDGFVPMQLQRENIAGAVVLVVKDNRVLFAKGYGYSDVEKKAPVVPDATLFRPGSISKLFTWTAVMQLVERGKLDLDHDVNSYLDFKIPEAFSKPITLRNLMTHTPGFEEQVKYLISDDESHRISLRDHLERYVPQRIFPPGTMPAYSNYGASLAGYIVEHVSGQPFNDYVAENIFKPLGMTRSTFAQPLPAELQPLMSSGYTVASGKSKKFEIIESVPAGALSATAADLSRFMMAHLQDGRLDNAQILRPETARMMHSRQLGLNPALNGMCLGFYEESRNGHRIIGHGGDTIYFHSDLHLILDAGVGFFVSYNSRGKGEISPRTALWTHFLDRYFPYSPAAVERPASAVADAESITGRYLTSRRSQSNFLRVTSLQAQVDVTREANGDIKVDTSRDFAGEVKKWQEVGQLVFRAVDGQDQLAFRRDESGRLQLITGFPAVVYQRVSFLQDSKFNGALVAICLSIMGLTLLFWPVGAIVRNHYHHRLELDLKQLRGRLWIRMVCALNIIFVLGMYFSLSSAGALELNDKLDLRINLFQVVGVLGVLGTLLVLVACIRSWGDRNLWGLVKAWNLLVLLACLGFTWFVLYWNLLDFRMNY